ALEVPERPAVDVVADEDLGLARGQLGDGGGRRGAAREGDAVAAAREVRDGAFEALAGGVLAAGVLVAAARPPDPVLRERRRLVDRRWRRPRGRSPPRARA